MATAPTKPSVCQSNGELRSCQIRVRDDFHERWPGLRQDSSNRRFKLGRIGDFVSVATAKLCKCGKRRVVQISFPDRPLAGPLLLGNLAELGIVEQDVAFVSLS